MSLLQFEFWRDQKSSYHSLFCGEKSQKEREAKRRYFAEQIEKIPRRPLRWLDVGSGDGAKVADVLQYLDFPIELTCIEPSKWGVAQLKRKFSSRVIEAPFSAEKLTPCSFDCITFFHANYYLANDEATFASIWERVLAALTPGGLLINQAVTEGSDFQLLGQPAYSLWAQGNHTFALLKRLSPHTQCVRFPTHLDVTDFLTKDPKEKLLLLYRFTKQQDTATPTKEQLRTYLKNLKRLATTSQGKWWLNFSDTVSLLGAAEHSLVSRDQEA